jgi:AraC-like DNA-binding protein
LHERTLQRRLAKQGVHFENIVDDIRQDLSRKYLAREGMPLAQLVNLLGYSEQSVFNRACQRWFGMPPMQFRKTLQVR